MQSDTKPRLSYSTNPEQQLSFSTQPFANQRTRAGLTALHARRLLGVAAGQSAQPHTAHQGACGSRRLCPTPPSFQAASTQDVRNKRLEHAREYHPIATPGRTRAAVLSATTSPFLSLAAADVSKSHWFLRVLWDSCAGQRGRAGAAADPQRRPGPVPLVRRCHWCVTQTEPAPSGESEKRLSLFLANSNDGCEQLSDGARARPISTSAALRLSGSWFHPRAEMRAARTGDGFQNGRNNALLAP